jgi:formylglycine-generating enzyme required for sulfatase activity
MSPTEQFFQPATKQQADMLLVPGGTFRMGSDKHYPEEAPVHRVTMDAFWMDRTPVTNRQFREFAEATGHVTLAEIAPDAKDYPGALPHMLKAQRQLAFVRAEYCRRYRSAARDPQPVDTSMSHVGFRCISKRGPSHDQRGRSENS